MNDHVATVNEIYAAFGRGDVPAILDRLAPDVAWDHDGESWGLPWYEPRTGRDQMPAFFAALDAEVVLHRFVPTNLLAGGNQVAAVIDLELEVKRSGTHLTDHEIHLWTFDDNGLVSRFAHVLDRHASVAAFHGVPA